MERFPPNSEKEGAGTTGGITTTMPLARQQGSTMVGFLKPREAKESKSSRRREIEKGEKRKGKKSCALCNFIRG